MTIIETLNEGIKDAMRNRDQIRLATFRMLKAKILAVDARAMIPDVEVVKLFKTYYGSLQEALTQANQAGRSDIADPLEKELKIIEEFLPKALSVEETKQIVLQAIEESGATTKKDLGQVMKIAMKLNAGIDGKLAKQIIDEFLV